MTQLDQRSQILLKSLVEHYIAEGQPVGSRALSRHSGLNLSPATVRNVMSDLEELGFITSPHTSAGRVPTARGYRFFVDSLLTVQPIGVGQLEAIQGQIQPGEPQRVINAASQLLSGLTHFAGVVVSPRQDALKIRQIEFVSLSDTRILLILVTTAGDVQNRILFTKRAYSPSELVTAANYLNQHFAGLAFTEIRTRIQDELSDAYLYTVDDLQGIIEQNLETRKRAAAEAELIVQEERDEFMGWYRSQHSVDLIRDYRHQSQQVADEELQRALLALQQGENAEQALKAMAHRLTNKLIHAPTQALRQAAAQGDSHKLAQLRQVLGLSQES